MAKGWFRAALTLSGIGFVLTLTGCISDAPRDNPLDPARGIRVSGKVERFYNNSGIPNAMIKLQPGHFSALAAADGSFAIDHIPAGNYTLSVAAAGFREDSLTLELRQSVSASFKLDALPFFRSISLTTQHISTFIAPQDSFFVSMAAAADDPDNRSDVKTVWYHVAEFGYTDTLFEASPQEKIFTGELDTGRLGLASIHELIGKSFVFYVEDLPGAASASEPVYITRIITDTPRGVAPINAAVTPPFQLHWQPLALPYPFTFHIEIKKVNFTFLTLAGEIRDIPANSTAATFSAALQPGEYIWLLYVVDEFGNRSRSLENPFIVP